MSFFANSEDSSPNSLVESSGPYTACNRTHSEGVSSFAFSLLLLLGHALISNPVLSFTQVLISSPPANARGRSGNRFKNRLDSSFRRNDVGKTVCHPVNKH